MCQKTKKLTALIDAVSPLVLESVISFSEYDWAVAHTRGRSEGSQGSCEDADDDLNDGLPSFLLHSAFFLGLDILVSKRVRPQALLSNHCQGRRRYHRRSNLS